MLENRQALAKDSKFEIENKIGSRTILTIIDVIGYGASCIVYKANDAIALSDSVETATRIVKEYYPRNVAGLTRKGNDILVPGTAKDAFAEGQLQFERGITRYIEYYEQYDLSANPRPFVFGSANGTVYSVSDLSTGKTLSNIDTKGLTLYRIANIMASLCDAIQRFHDNNLLYLDCKPDNIFFYTYDHREDHVRLFDFDTVMPIDEIKAHPEIRSYSKGWAPSELVMGRSEEIGKETDIFSVGAVFFWLFTGRSPWDKASDIMDIENGLFQWNRIPLLKNASTDVASLVRHIAEKTLLSYSTRYHDISRLKADFIDLAAYTEGSVKTHKPIYEVLKGINDSMLLLSQQEVNPKEATEIKCDEGDKQRKTGYEGELIEGIPNGAGIYYLPNGDRYEGLFKDGKPFGTNTYYFAESALNIRALKGEFSGFSLPSTGILYYADGDVYEGDLKDGIPNGRGVLHSKDGRRFNGDFIDGIINGLGALNRENGDIFIGTFKDGLWYKGTYYHHNSAGIYKGEYKEGKRSGYGIFYFVDGSKQEGTFKDDKLYGSVLVTDQDGTTHREYYIAGDLVDFKKYESTDIDDPAFRDLKIRRCLSTIKERNYSFMTKDLIYKACSTIRLMMRSEDGTARLQQSFHLFKNDLIICKEKYSKEGIRSGDSSLFEITGIIDSTIEDVEKCIADDARINSKIYSGWGPPRNVYDESAFVTYPTFNSQTGDPKLGDERLFIQVWKNGEIVPEPCPQIIPGEQYSVRIYYRNNANSGIGNDMGSAKEVKVSANFPTVLREGSAGKISGVIHTSNADPLEVWSHRIVKTSYDKLYLRYLPETAKIYNDGILNGSHLPMELFSYKGTYIGHDSFDGVIPPDSTGYVEFSIESTRIAGEISQSVSYDGINYQEQLQVTPGSEIYFRVEIINVGDVALSNPTVKGLLSKGLSVVPGSIMFSANESEKRDQLSDNYCKNGFNFGKLGAGNTIYVYYKCNVSKDAKANDALMCSSFLFYDNERKEGEQKTATNLLKINKGAITPWGPERKTFTWTDPASYATFNSITDNPDIGDERNFVRIREANAHSKFSDEVSIRIGKIYEVYIYYDNNASPSLANSHHGTALEVKIRSSYPTLVSQTKKSIVSATIDSANTNPSAVWDGAYISADEDTELRYVPNSLRIHSFTETHGNKLNEKEFFSMDGTLISTHSEQPGTITCKEDECSGYITYCLLAQGTIKRAKTTLQASLDGENWSNSVCAAPGTYITIKTSFENIGNTTLTNVIFKALHDDDLTLRYGSTTVFSDNQKNGKTIDDIIDLSGYNTGNQRMGTLTQLIYQARVNDDITLCGKTLLWTSQIEYNGKVQDSNTIEIKVTFPEDRSLQSS